MQTELHHMLLSDGGGSADCSGRLLHSQETCVRTINSSGYRDSVFISGYRLYSRMASCLDHLSVCIYNRHEL